MSGSKKAYGVSGRSVVDVGIVLEGVSAEVPCVVSGVGDLVEGGCMKRPLLGL